MASVYKFAICSSALVVVLSVLSGCTEAQTRHYPYFKPVLAGIEQPPVVRQPVVPEMLVGCRGHVLVPALGMKFVAKGEALPEAGQYLREENLTAPYRILPPGARVSQEHSAARLNIELDGANRLIGLYCG